MTKKFQRRFLTILATIALVSTYVAIGFALCAGFPQITRSLSSANSAFDTSPYDREDLIELALETRDYTVDDYGRESAGVEGAHIALAEEVLSAARNSSSSSSPTADRWSPLAQSIVQASNDPSPDVTMENLAESGLQYALSDEALDHLDDVNGVITSLRMPLLGCALIAAFCLMGLVYLFGAKPAGTALVAGGAITLGLFLGFGLWAAFGFDSLFAALHSLFFAEGTWTFPSDSLLIQMYPEGFWMGMGGWWLGASTVVALASIIIGYVIIRKRKPKVDEPFVPAGNQA